MTKYHAEYTPLQKLDLWMRATNTTRFTVAHYWGLHHGAVTRWFREGKFPESRMAQLEALLELAPEDAPRIRCRLTAIVEALPRSNPKASRVIIKAASPLPSQPRLF